MLILYYRPTCAFSKKVLAAAKELGVGLEVRDIGEGTHAQELIKRGGKQQVPYLIDQKRGTELYESDEIVDYLQKVHGSAV